MDLNQESFDQDGDTSMFARFAKPSKPVEQAESEAKPAIRAAAPGRGARPPAEAPAPAEDAPQAETVEQTESDLYKEYAVAEPEASPEAAASTVASPPANDMESILRGAMDDAPQQATPAPRVAPGRFVPSATEASAGEGMSEGADGEGPEAESQDVPADPEDPEVDPTLIDSLIYKGVENAQAVCEALVRSGGLPPSEVAQFWSDYAAYSASDGRRERIEGLDRRAREILADEARLMKQEAAAGAAGGGALASLFGPMMARRQARRQAAAKEILASNKVALEADKLRSNNEFGMRAHGRLWEVKKRAYNESMARLFGQVDDMAASVRSYNDTFMDCPEATEFKAEAMAYAESSGLGIPEIMQAVAEGRAPEALQGKFASVKERALANPDVEAAYRRIMDDEERVAEGYRGAIKEGEQMFRLNPTVFDQDRQRESIMESLELAVANTPKPVAEGEGRDMAERMAKLAESLQEAFAKVFETIAALFRR